MKSLFFAPITVLLLLFSSCGSSENQVDLKKEDLQGIWTLFKETKGNKTIDYSGEPTASRYEFKENGYFVFYDQITNKRISDSGVGSIQDLLKGQYEVENGEIQLNHYVGDSLVTKAFTVERLAKGQLVLVDKKNSKTSYFKK